MTHIEIQERTVTINGGTTFTMAPNSETTVEGITLRCDKFGIVSVASCASGPYSLHQTIGHLPKGATVVGYTHVEAPRPPRPPRLPKQRPASGTPLFGRIGTPDMGPGEFPKITSLPPEQLLYMIETVSAAQVMLFDGRQTEAVNLVNKMADQLGIRDEINAAVLKFMLGDGEPR